jgi:hypothetical protein
VHKFWREKAPLLSSNLKFLLVSLKGCWGECMENFLKIPIIQSYGINFFQMGMRVIGKYACYFIYIKKDLSFNRINLGFG